ncbi:phosphoglycolate phosphatase [Marinobacterium sp. MBR-109]|jgi:phosphoglycolate phosphatase|uniref:phosphoglycolate phosphatase n=1 Tax=Marinobacterium sp. MBR-109 TaxID=3156462 RepID=UPI0033933634
MATIDAVLFDLDGTLLDSARDFHRIVNRMLAEAGREPMEFNDLRTQVSNGARAMVMHAFKLEQDVDAFPALHRQLLDYYGADTCQHSQLFDDIEPLLTWLEQKGIRWGIVTNKPQRFTLTLLDKLGLTERCASLVCPEDVRASKPDPEGLWLACEQLGADPARCIYVGDHRRDIEAGHAAGMITIAAAWGYLNANEQAEDWNSHYISHQPSELQPLLNSLLSQAENILPAKPGSLRS